jgi:hypothetical protein
VLAVAALCVTAPLAAATVSPTPTDAGGIATTRVAATAVTSARSYWTAARMAAATPLPNSPKAYPAFPVSATPAAPQPADETAPPPGTPDPSYFDGVPTVGALFFTTGSKEHFCTASAVAAPTQNLILTAAHCVYGSTPSNIAYVPEYHDGRQPYGAWPATAIYVAKSWQTSADPNVDYAFLSVTPPAGTKASLDRTTGALLLGAYTGYSHHIEVIGYNNTDDEPLGCVTTSAYFEPDQQQFNCNSYWDGTSGGPWITDFNAKTGTGVLIGDIGGYHEGGDYPWTSYSPYYDGKILLLFARAEAAQLP